MPHWETLHGQDLLQSKDFLIMGSVSLLLMGFICGNRCLFLVDSTFLLKAGAVISFAKVVIMKTVNGNGLTETMVNYQICQLISCSLHRSWRLHSWGSCKQRRGLS